MAEHRAAALEAPQVMTGFKVQSTRLPDFVAMQAFRFEQGEDDSPVIKAEGEAAAIARFLMKHAYRPHQIEALLIRTDSVLSGRTPCELIKDDYEQLELDGGQYVARATQRAPDTIEEHTVALSLAKFRDLLIEWRAFVLERWQQSPW
jgi:hypothetical protein